MALPDSLKLVTPAGADRIIFADATDWPSGGTDTWGNDDDQLDMTGITSGQARESDKFAVPTNKELEYDVYMMLEYATDPVSGETCDAYYGLSFSSTDGIGNPGGLSGVDADFTGTAGDSLDDSLKQLNYIGSMIMTADNSPENQQQLIGVVPGFNAPELMVVLDNNTSDSIHTDAVECALMFVGRETQIQDAVTT